MTPTNLAGARHGTPVDLAALAVLDGEIDATVLGGEPEFSVDELAVASGWSSADLADIFLWAGLPSTDHSLRLYTQSDLIGLRKLKALQERDHLSKEAIGTLVRSLSYAMERLALTQVEGIVNELAKTGLSDTAARFAAAEYAPTQGEELLEQIIPLWRRHFAAAIHRLTTVTILHRGVSDEDRQFPLVCAVGYANVVDFTSYTANFGVSDYANFVQDIHNRVADIVNGSGGRIIKFMGDFIVWASVNPENAADIALQIKRLHELGVGPQLQIALTWARVMSIHGDIFGPGVNRVSVLAKLTPPGEVYVDESATEQLERNPRFKLTAGPPLEIKGLGEVHPSILREVSDTRPLPD